MGTVHEAVDERLGRAVAVKLLPPTAEHHGERLRQEAKVLARLDHPCLVRVLDIDEDQDRPFIVMELVEGSPLSERLHGGALGERTVAALGADVAEGLAHAHAHGVVHRDLKPANIVLSEHGPARIIDFGIARVVDATGLTDTGTILGTAAYLAPEQLSDGKVGPAADVYTLGLVLIEALSGHRAFDGNAVESAAARLDHAPELPSGLDATWSSLLREMTSLEPDERPPADDVAARLSAVAPVEGRTASTAMSEPSPARAVTEPIGRTEVLAAPPDAVAAPRPRVRSGLTSSPAARRAGAWVRLHRWPAALAGLAVVVLLGVGVGVLTADRDEPPPIDRNGTVPPDLADALEGLEQAVDP